MSVLDSMDSLMTDTLSVSRYAVGTWANGIYTPVGSPTRFTIQAVVMPAYNLNRVVGGADLHAMVDDEKVTEVRQLYTRTELRTRTPTNDPDIVTNYEGASWTVIRVEKWTLIDQTAFHVVISKQTQGAS